LSTFDVPLARSGDTLTSTIAAPAAMAPRAASAAALGAA
jgi:hypothetical protein